MKLCPTCRTKYPDDANFCPQEACATPDGPQRLQEVSEPKPVEAPRGRFQIMSRLGGSGTGVVSKARDTESGAEVAYKVVATEVLPSAAAMSRAEREFKQLMRVQSPKIATIIDCGRTPEDQLYVAMELCAGEPLDGTLKGGPMPFDKAKALIAQIGQALLEAQKAGIVHRDVSPKNVLVSSTKDVKVINFPIARPVTEKVSGVPAYVSPEQAQGKPVDQRSNTYSLACIFYHLLTGEPPFQAPTPQGVLELHISSPPLPPSQRRPEANLSADIDRVILKALDKNSSRRHLTLRLFLTEIEGLSVPSGAGHAAPSAAKGEGFAKTMLFAGGQAEVANLVKKAIAARTSSTPAGGSPALARTATPASGSAMPAMAPAQQVAAAVAATMVAPVAREASSPVVAPVARPSATMPATSSAPIVVAPAVAAVPMAAPVTAEAPAAGKAAPAGKAASGKDEAVGFRETLWFKKGDVDQMVAEAKAKLAQGAAAAKPAEVELPGEDVRPLEDRYLDDGSVTTDDRKKFSLRSSGATSTAMPAARPKAVPGESMSDQEVMDEIAGTRRTMILIIVGAVITAVVVALLMMMRSKSPAPAGALPHAETTLPDPAAPAAIKPSATTAAAEERPGSPETPPPAADVGKSEPAAAAPAETETALKKKPSHRRLPRHKPH